MSSEQNKPNQPVSEEPTAPATASEVTPQDVAPAAAAADADGTPPAAPPTGAGSAADSSAADSPAATDSPAASTEPATGEATTSTTTETGPSAPATGEGTSAHEQEAVAPATGEATGGADAGTEESAPAAAGDATGSDEADGKKKRKRRRRKKKSSGQHHASDRTPFHPGEEVFGKVTAVLETAIMVDLSGKALAIFDRGEMEPDDLVPAVEDRFVAKVLADGGRGGLVVLTRKPLREEEVKPKVEQAAKDGTLVEGLVTGVIKGGVEVLIDGLRAFAPASGMDLHPRTANFAQLLGSRLDFKVATYDKQGREVVVTRRPMLEKEAHERRKKAREVLQEGMEMDGVVRTVVDWGAFVAMPEAEFLEGLVHMTEVSHNPRERVTDVLKPGQKLKVKIQKIDDKGKIWLSRKALIEDPFEAIAEQVKVGEIVEGEVTRVEDFGAFIKLPGGFEGLCHVADLSPVRVEDAKTVVEAGSRMQVVVHGIDRKQRRIALHPALPPEQADEPKQRVGKGQKLQVEVRKVEQVGLNVRILGATGRQARGFIPAAQSGVPRGGELRKRFNVGDKLEALVVDVDPKRHESKLSITRLAQEEERRAHKEYRTKLKAEANFGTLGDLLKDKLGGD